MTRLDIINFTIIFIQILREIITLLIIGRVVASWFTFGVGGRGSVTSFLITATDPVMNFFKKLPHRIGMIDLSPLIALVAIDIFSRLITMLLSKLA